MLQVEKAFVKVPFYEYIFITKELLKHPLDPELSGYSRTIDLLSIILLF